MMKTRIPITDERGIAFPMAMIVLTVLMALMAAFAFLATSEPQIAANHMASVQARSLAESGLERALWALTQGEASPAPAGTLVNSGPPNYTIAIVSPYDGSTFVSMSSAGGFKVTVSELTPPVINQKVVTAVGFVRSVRVFSRTDRLRRFRGHPLEAPPRFAALFWLSWQQDGRRRPDPSEVDARPHRKWPVRHYRSRRSC